MTRSELTGWLSVWGWRLTFALLALGGSGVGLLFLWLSVLLGGRVRLSLPRGCKRILLPLGVCLTISSLLASKPGTALAACLGSLAMILTAFSVNEKTPPFEELSRLSFYGSLAAAAAAFTAPFRGLPRAEGFVGANAFGTTIFLGAALGLYYLNSSPERKRWLWPFLILMGLAELLTFSRGGWLGFLTMCLVFFIRERKAVKVLAALLVLFAFLAVLWPPLAQRAQSIVSLAANQDRVRIYRRTVEMIKEHPWTGIGSGNFQTEYAKYCLPKEEIVTHAHNIYLSVAVEFGLPAGILFLALLGRMLLAAYRTRKRAGMIILPALLGCLVHGLFDITVFGIHVGMAFWALGGFALYQESQLAARTGTLPVSS